MGSILPSDNDVGYGERCQSVVAVVILLVFLPLFHGLELICPFNMHRIEQHQRCVFVGFTTMIPHNAGYITEVGFLPIIFVPVLFSITATVKCLLRGVGNVGQTVAVAWPKYIPS